MPKSRLARFKLYATRARDTTRGSRDARWQEVVAPMASSAAATALVLLGFGEGRWWAALLLALAAGVLSVAISYVLSFLRNLVLAPKRYRDSSRIPPEHYGHSVLGTVTVRGSDTMQGQAWVIKVAIYLGYIEENTRPGRCINTYERDRLQGEATRCIGLFETRTREDWAERKITRKSWRRSLELHQDVKAAGDDFALIHELCDQLIGLKPSH